MASWWRALPRAARRYPWPTNVLLYTALYSAGDALQQRLRGCPADWRQTQHVATVAVTFHANFNYVWLRLLERALPGRAPRAVLAKVLCDQVLAAPVAVSAFYSGMSILQGKEDIFLDLKQKFWNTYKREAEYHSGMYGAKNFMFADWSDVLAFCTADQLQPSSHSLENGLHGTLWFSLGYLPLLLTTGWRWYIEISFHHPS